MRVVDLSHAIKGHGPEVPDLLRVEVELSDHAEGARAIEQMFGVPPRLLRDGEGWAVDTIRLGTHSATHVDAPWHYNSTIRGRRAQTIDELPLDWFLGPGVVVDARAKADGDAVTRDEMEAGIAAAGHELRPGDIVLVRTGRDERYEQPDYMALGPGVTAEATLWLCDRGVRVMGIDAWGWDRPLWMQAEEAKARDEGGVFWAAHQVDRPYCQLERLANLGAIPPTGFTVACFPLKIEGASAGPARVAAILDG